MNLNNSKWWTILNQIAIHTNNEILEVFNNLQDKIITVYPNSTFLNLKNRLNFRGKKLFNEQEDIL